MTVKIDRKIVKYSVPSFSTMSLMVTYIAWSEIGVLIL